MWALNFKLEPGTLFADRYRILELLGRGDSGSIYKVEDQSLGSICALKILDPRYATDQERVERLKREVLFSRKVAHENAVRIYDHGELEGIHYVTMDYVEGKSLRERLKDSPPLNTLEKLQILDSICSALDVAHRQKVVHRNIKTSNVMLETNGKVKLLDFGIAYSADLGDLTSLGTISGSSMYMAPELWQGKKADSRSDIYALGVMMYLLFADRPPFESKSVQGLCFSHLTEAPPPIPNRTSLPTGLEAIILTCLQKEPDRRYTFAGEVSEALAPIIAATKSKIKSDQARPSPPPPKLATTSSSSSRKPPSEASRRPEPVKFEPKSATSNEPTRSAQAASGKGAEQTAPKIEQPDSSRASVEFKTNPTESSKVQIRISVPTSKKDSEPASKPAPEKRPATGASPKQPEPQPPKSKSPKTPSSPIRLPQPKSGPQQQTQPKLPAPKLKSNPPKSQEPTRLPRSSWLEKAGIVALLLLAVGVLGGAAWLFLGMNEEDEGQSPGEGQEVRAEGTPKPPVVSLPPTVEGTPHALPLEKGAPDTNDLGKVYRQRVEDSLAAGRYVEAVDTYGLLLRLSPNEPSIQEKFLPHLGKLLNEIRQALDAFDPEKAQGLLTIVLRIDPGNPVVPELSSRATAELGAFQLYLSAKQKFEAGDMEGSWADLGLVAATYPDWSEIQKLRTLLEQHRKAKQNIESARAMIQQERFAQAAELLRQAADLEPGIEGLKEARQALERAKAAADARRKKQGEAARNSRVKEYFNFLDEADLMEQAGQFGEAIQTLRKAAKIAPDPEARKNLDRRIQQIQAEMAGRNQEPTPRR